MTNIWRKVNITLFVLTVTRFRVFWIYFQGDGLVKQMQTQPVISSKQDFCAFRQVFFTLKVILLKL